MVLWLWFFNLFFLIVFICGNVEFFMVVLVFVSVYFVIIKYVLVFVIFFVMFVYFKIFFIIYGLLFVLLVGDEVFNFKKLSVGEIEDNYKGVGYIY